MTSDNPGAEVVARAEAGAEKVLATIRAAVPVMDDHTAAILRPALAMAWTEGWYAAGDEVKELLAALRDALTDDGGGREAVILKLIPKEETSDD